MTSHRRELVRCFIVGLLQFGGGVLLIMALTWAWLAAHQ